MTERCKEIFEVSVTISPGRTGGDGERASSRVRGVRGGARGARGARASLDGAGVGAGGGLGEAEGGVLPAGDARQVLLLLRRVAEQQDALEADGLVRAQRDAHAQVVRAHDLRHEPAASHPDIFIDSRACGSRRDPRPAR